MHHHYDDIRSRIAEAPLWWDENAVPRYCTFAPGAGADIYCDEIALVEIACQGCDTRYLVAMSHGSTRWGAKGLELHGMWTREDVERFHYGDPPNAQCCAAGPTMNCIDLRVVEFWRHHDPQYTKPDPHLGGTRVCTEGYFDWRRVPELEIRLEVSDDR